MNVTDSDNNEDRSNVIFVFYINSVENINFRLEHEDNKGLHKYLNIVNIMDRYLLTPKKTLIYDKGFHTRLRVNFVYHYKKVSFQVPRIPYRIQKIHTYNAESFDYFCIFFSWVFRFNSVYSKKRGTGAFPAPYHIWTKYYNISEKFIYNLCLLETDSNKS